MPVTFNLFRIRNFPTQPTEAGGVVFQQGDQELRGTPAKTKVTFQKADAEHNLEMYVSEHEMLKRVEGRLYTGEEFQEFYKKNQVIIVVDRVKQLLACKCSGMVAKDLVDDWNNRAPYRFRADYLHLDLEGIRTRINEVRGIWRSGLNQPNVETFAVFGPEVDKSSLYEALSDLGYVASMLISHQVVGNNIPVIVSAKGSVTFPQPAAEDEQVDRLLGLYDSVLKYGLVEVESKKTLQEKRDRDRAITRASKAK